MNTRTNFNLRDALRMVRTAAPDAIQAIDAQAAPEAAAKVAEVKRLAGAERKVVDGLAARTAAIVADYEALERAAIRSAAETLAREGLEAEFGITSREERAMYPAPARLGRSRVESSRSRLADSAPIPWDRAGRSADRLRSDNARELRPEALSPAQAATEAAKLDRGRRAEMEARRVAAVNARKEAARAAGVIK